MEKELIQELKYDLHREKDIDKQVNLIIVTADMLCAETQQDAWDFFQIELNDALIGNKNITDMLQTLEKNLRKVKIKVMI